MKHDSILCIILFLIINKASSVQTGLPLESIKLPVGFKIELVARVENARSLALDDKGTLFIGTRDAGKVFALKNSKGVNQVYTIAKGLNMPNGVALKHGNLYVAEVSRILCFPSIASKLSDPPPPIVIYSNYPRDTHHGWKFIRFGPDGLLYVPVGAPCNACERKEEVYASITRLSVDVGEMNIIARGVRNTVGFDWHPVTKELWFTDNGRDWLGDNSPPDELNRASTTGLHFGYPYIHGADIEDPEFYPGAKNLTFTPPELQLGPHVAALGMRFYTGKSFPEKYRNQIFIAEHGSWNRSKKTGYRITLVRLENNRAVSYETFADGWLVDEKAWGRPVDIEVAADGSLLVSDDKAGAIYRIYYKP